MKKKNISLDRYSSFLKRKEAIEDAIKRANEGDLIVVLGRGNEKTMDYGTKVVSFDDREVVKEVLKEQKYL